MSLIHTILPSLGGSRHGHLRFDERGAGSTDILLKSSNLTGITSSKVGLLSYWAFTVPEAAEPVKYNLVATATSTIRFFSYWNGRIFLYGYNSSGDIIVQCFTNPDGSLLGRWYHVLASWDTSTSTVHFYINGSTALVNTAAVLADDTIDFSNITEWECDIDNGRLAELYFTTEYLDLSVESNRRKFLTADNSPANLGYNGSIPTGTSPILYLSQRVGLPNTDFVSNKGSGGNFTISSGSPEVNSNVIKIV